MMLVVVVEHSHSQSSVPEGKQVKCLLFCVAEVLRRLSILYIFSTWNILLSSGFTGTYPVLV